MNKTGRLDALSILILVLLLLLVLWFIKMLVS